MIKFSIFFFILFAEIFADLWEQDVTQHIQIGLAETGYKRVDLKCGASSFLVNVTLENDFEGVVYTRGSFDNKMSSCFKSHKQGVPIKKNSVLITLDIPFNECHTVMNEFLECKTKNETLMNENNFSLGLTRGKSPDRLYFFFKDVSDSQYRNVVIVQHEPEFIMPGDAAFALDCSFTPEFRMTTNIVTEPDYKSRITLVDADPGSEITLKDEKYRTQSNEETVSFFPLADRSKDEL